MAASTSPTPAVLTPIALRCEDFDQPLGLDVAIPRLSWQLPLLRRGAGQTAYQVLVADTLEAVQAGHGDLWDSGRVNSAQSLNIQYQGRPLQSRQRCFWAVRVWDEHDQLSAYSASTWWEMGLLNTTDWQAQWIAPPNTHSGDSAVKPAPYLRAVFTAEQPVVAARAYICGLGYHEFYLNGHRVGDEVLAPTFTKYDIRSLYLTHDITKQITVGENAVGVILGTGWYNCHTLGVWDFETASWRHHPQLLLQIHLLFADGSTRVVSSDHTWKTANGPLIFDGLRNGETYDARLEMHGWSQPGFHDSAWQKVEITPGPGGDLSAQLLPCKVMHTIIPTALWEVRPGVYVFDMGQNFAGWVQLTVRGPANSEVTLRYGEVLTEARDVDQEHIGVFIKSGDIQTDRYILKGKGREVWEPRFVYHGFRYVQMTGFPGVPTLDALRGRVVHTAFPTAGSFSCGNDMLNAVQQCTRWSYISNFVGIPTDCPHREKNGWTGDAQLAAETGLFNYLAAPAYHKWLQDFADVQRPNGQLPGIVPTSGWGFNWGSGPAWDSAYLHIAWYIYLYRGSTAALSVHYSGMKRYVDFMTRMASTHIVSFGLGDWCPPESQDGYGHACPIPLTSTGYYYANCRLLARTAELLGHAEDAVHYSALAEEIKIAFNRTFYNSATGQYASGDPTAQGCALFQGLVEAHEEKKVLAQLLAALAAKDFHPWFGILGAKYVLNALSECGHPEIAYALATQTTYPSWGDWIAQGATTLWESWEGTTSRNHIMFGDISAWMFKTLAGIAPDPAQPGFRHINLHPHPITGLSAATGVHQGPFGEIISAWVVEDEHFILNVCVPANSFATLTLPTMDAAAVTEHGHVLTHVEGITNQGTSPDGLVLSLVAGKYRFSVVNPRLIPALS